MDLGVDILEKNLDGSERIYGGCKPRKPVVYRGKFTRVVSYSGSYVPCKPVNPIRDKKTLIIIIRDLSLLQHPIIWFTGLQVNVNIWESASYLEKTVNLGCKPRFTRFTEFDKLRRLG